MSKYVSAWECGNMTAYLRDYDVTTSTVAESFDRCKWIVGKHARSDCSHDTEALAYKNDIAKWVVASEEETPSWGRDQSSSGLVCGECKGALDENQECGFCERFDAVHGVGRDKIAGFGGVVVAD